jgi:hypothetical protein
MKKYTGWVLACVAACSSLIIPQIVHGDNDLNYFVIGVFLQQPSNPQHSDNFGYWKNLGVNTLVLADAGPKPQKGYTVKEWDAAAKSHGLKTIREPSGDYSYDYKQFQSGNLIALSLPDEPDKYAGDYSQSTAQQLVSMSQVIRSHISGVPIYSTFATYPNYGRDAWYKTVYSQGVDTIGYDEYPINIGYPMSVLNDPINRIADVSGKRPIMFIETGDIGLKNAPQYQQSVFDTYRPKMRGPTPQELKIEMAQAVANGATGMVFFPQKVAGGFMFDNTPAANAAMIKQQTAIWQGLTADPGTAILGLPNGVVGRRRLLNGVYRTIVANTNPQSVVVGAVTFGPYEYKIFDDTNLEVTPITSNVTGVTRSPKVARPPRPLSATCYANGPKLTLRNTSRWSVAISGGIRPYSYVWTGSDGLVSHNARIAVRFQTIGTKTMNVTVSSSDGQVQNLSCPDVTLTAK